MKVSRDSDILLCLFVIISVTLIILYLPSLSLLRVLLGLPFILLLPGYTLLSAVYVRNSPIDLVERLVLSFSLSLAIIPLVGVALNLTPWGLRPESFLLALDCFVILTCSMSFFRRRRLSPQETFAFPLAAALNQWTKSDIRVKALGPLLGIVLVGAGGVVFAAATESVHFGGFTEFYVQSSTGKIEDLPQTVVAGQAINVRLGVINHEGLPNSYKIAVQADGSIVAESAPFELAEGERREERISFLLRPSDTKQQVEFLLYRSGLEGPYRTLYLWLQVRPA